ncbi:hypothetical protein [Klebsiella quasivariicola]|uniref:hypothetical protein n=1 Tax=Klebsiella quasivariicola TaxID=2026240 RepID=UPI00247AE5BD|nr:hypothetical protein [Klebsiella quasivariicola]
MYQKQYQMAVLVTPDSENDPEWPSKKKWFDASEWLRNPQYIKIDDFYILNIKYVPIEKINDFRITRAIHRSIVDSVNLEPNLSLLSQMNDDTFYIFMKDNLSYEYLRTEFNSETLTPVNDYFLFFFTYKGANYEVVLLREPYKNGGSFPYAGFVHKAGYWHSTSLEGYSFRDYLAGKPVK